MNVTHVVENLNRGGLERVVIDLIGAQRALGCEVRVICLFEPGTLAPELQAQGVEVESCGKRNGLDLRALRRARTLMRRFGTEVLHTHNAAAHYYATAAAVGLPVRRRINTRHGMGATRASTRREWLYRLSLRATDWVVTVCEAARRDLLERGLAARRGVLAIPNGIRVEQFEPGSDDCRAALRRELGFGPDTAIVGTVGRLNWAKDHPVLLHAFAALRARLPDVGLVVVGGGERREAIEALVGELGIGDAVRLLGDRSDVRALLRGFDVFALSSRTEGYSLALLEASAAALPIVATDVGGNAEIVREGVSGHIVPARDPAALAAALADVLVDPARARDMGAAARAWVLEQGSLARMAERYRDVYAA